MVSGVLSYQQLGNRLIRLAEHAHAFRQFDKVKELGQLLANIPIKSFQAIGHYFLGVAANSKGNGDQDESKKLFELAVDTAPDEYKVKAILSLGALSFHKRDFDSALRFYRETIKAGRLSAASFQAIRGISTIKSIEGSHAHAVRDLEAILPLIKYAPAQTCFDVFNSYAVELGETGRIYEARNISRIVLASPFTFAYPEWQETANDLKGPNRSLVIIGPSKFIPNNVLPMPAIEPGEMEQTSYNQPAKVFNLQRLRKKMAKGKKSKKDKKENGGKVFDENVDKMDDKDLLATLIQIAAKDDVDEEKLRDVVKYAIKTLGLPRPK